MKFISQLQITFIDNQINKSKTLCGVFSGLFFFGVAEPVWHYTTKNRCRG